MATRDHLVDDRFSHHYSYFGFNSSTGAFNSSNIDSQSRRLLDTVRVTNEQLNDEDTTTFVDDLAEERSGIANLQLNEATKQNRGPPPPSNSGGGGFGYACPQPLPRDYGSASPPHSSFYKEDGAPALLPPPPVGVQMEGNTLQKALNTELQEKFRKITNKTWQQQDSQLIDKSSTNVSDGADPFVRSNETKPKRPMSTGKLAVPTFRHSSHVGSTGVINSSNIDSQSRRLLDTVRVTNEQLNDEDTTTFVDDLAEECSGNTNHQLNEATKQNRGPPPPSNSGRGGFGYALPQPLPRDYGSAFPPHSSFYKEDGAPALLPPPPVGVQTEGNTLQKALNTELQEKFRRITNKTWQQQDSQLIDKSSTNVSDGADPFVRSNETKPKRPMSTEKLAVPTFHHSSHVGSTGVIDSSNIDSQSRRLLDTVRVTNEQLNDEDTTTFVDDLAEERSGNTNHQLNEATGQNCGPPPLSNSGRGGFGYALPPPLPRDYGSAFPPHFSFYKEDGAPALLPPPPVGPSQVFTSDLSGQSGPVRPSVQAAIVSVDEVHTRQLQAQEQGFPTNKKQYRLIDVTPDSSEWYNVSESLVKANFYVHRIQQIKNKKLRQRFMFEMDQMLQEKKDVNMHRLYHTTRANASVICEEGLDLRLSKNGRFGRGIYFSDDPTKCDSYWRSDLSSLDVSRQMFMCKVLLGDIKEYEENRCDRSLKKEPPKKHPKHGESKTYDSVKGRIYGQNEYVVYNAYRVMPKYLLEYTVEAYTGNTDSKMGHSLASGMMGYSGATGSHMHGSSVTPKETRPQEEDYYYY